MGYPVATPSLAPARRAHGGAVPSRRWRALVLPAFLALHVPLGIAAARGTALATGHALLTFGVALALAVLGRHRIHVAYAAAYIVGAEVLWRLTGAGVPWEFGKLAIASVLLVGIIRAPSVRGLPLPFLYVALLLPSALLTIQGRGLLGAREELSFNLAGPIALGVSAWFFAHLRMEREQLRRLCLAAVAPMLSVAALAAFGIVTAATIDFGTQSNVALSGGALPVQVSSVLGLGALLATLCAVVLRTSRGLQIMLMLVAIALAAQSALTFSRGGLYCAGGAAILAFVLLMRDAAARLRLVVAGVLLFAVANTVVFPRLNAFTGGALETRFRETSVTGRDRIVAADLEIFRQHPLLGVGPGRGPKERQRILGRAYVAHTEYARLLAEHGALGILALATLVGLALRNVLRANDAPTRAFVVGLLGWSFLFMASDGMRLAAPSFLIGMTCAVLTSARGVIAFGSRPASQPLAGRRLDAARA